jgi:hypothetical protein
VCWLADVDAPALSDHFSGSSIARESAFVRLLTSYRLLTGNYSAAAGLFLDDASRILVLAQSDKLRVSEAVQLIFDEGAAQ